MATLNEMKEQYRQGVANAQHVMIVGATKTGKSEWAANIAKAGGTVLYADSDNGLATLMARLEGDEAAMSRVHYFAPASLIDFVEAFLTQPRFRFNTARGVEFKLMGQGDDEEVAVIVPSRLINKPVVLVIDSWTTLAYSATTAKAKKSQIDLTEIEKFGRDIYGGVGFRLTNVAQMIQLSPFNVVVQAHPSIYEIREKPPGRIEDIKESDMILRATWEVPASSSNPHGYSLGKYFTNIGWLEIGAGNRRELSFEVKRNRIAGGSISTKGDPRTTHSFASLFYPSGIPDFDLDGAIEYTTVAELRESLKSKAKPEAAAKATTIPSSPAASGGPQAKPALKLPAGLGKR